MIVPAPIILASASKSRAVLLRQAGLRFDIVPADVDEESVKRGLRAQGAAAGQCAEKLAELKAIKVSQINADVLVIGADQMLECDGTWFDKPRDLAEARATLLALRGKTHVLPTSVAVATNGSVVWRHSAAPCLTMRAFAESFVDRYLADVGELALASVGAYQLEGRGVQLFSKIDGDFFTILGLPLLELLAFLRERHVVPP